MVGETKHALLQLLGHIDLGIMLADTKAQFPTKMGHVQANAQRDTATGEITIAQFLFWRTRKLFSCIFDATRNGRAFVHRGVIIRGASETAATSLFDLDSVMLGLVIYAVEK